MEALKAEFERKRKQLDKAAAVRGAPCTILKAPEKKFFRRGDLAAKQQEEYWTKYYEKHADKRPKIQIVVDERLLSEEERKYQRVLLLIKEKLDCLCDESRREDIEDVLWLLQEKRISEDDALRRIEEEQSINLSPEEVRKRLRERGQPVRIFAETQDEAYRRLRKLEIDQPDMKEGWKNDFQSALDKVDEEYMNEVIQGVQHVEGKHDVQVEKDVQEMEDIEKMIKEVLGKDKPSRDCEIIFAFYNYLMQRWGRDLNSREESSKRSSKGKFESATHKQTVDHIRPLFNSLKNKSVASDIREHLVHITKIMAERDYIRANNAYMEMAIGNAPWPVGVTRSGIHQRPGSAKMYVSNIAHVLNDETQRKYIQGLKRLMTKCQEYFPADPSRSVDFVGKKG